MNIQRFALLTCLVFAMGASRPSAAIPFGFDPTGTGTFPIQADTIIHAPGNVLAVGGVTAFNNYMSSGGTCPANSCAFQIDYQANLEKMTYQGSTVFTQGTGGSFFNFTMSLGAKITAATITPGVSAVAGYALDPSASTNAFNMYAASSDGDNLTGANFGVSIPILAASFTAFTGNYTTDIKPSNQTLMDQFGVDNWSGQMTAPGLGTLAQTMIVHSVNSGYFPGLLPNTASFLAITPMNPYTLVDPSHAFVWAGIIPNIGPVNGVNGVSGPDLLMEADPTQIFFLVPEPGTISLVGLGLTGIWLGKFQSRRALRSRVKAES